MYRPSEEDKHTFARHIAKSEGMSIRAVRKARQRGQMTTKSVPMPQAQGAGEREERYEPLEKRYSMHGNPK